MEGDRLAGTLSTLSVFLCFDEFWGRLSAEDIALRWDGMACDGMMALDPKTNVFVVASTRLVIANHT
jgi:hypothetical protein